MPGHIVIRVFKTNLDSCPGKKMVEEREKYFSISQNSINIKMPQRSVVGRHCSKNLSGYYTHPSHPIYLVLKFMRFKAPILRDDASVNNFECNSITRHIRYSRRNIGNDNATSYGTVSVPICLFLLANLVVH